MYFVKIPLLPCVEPYPIKDSPAQPKIEAKSNAPTRFAHVIRAKPFFSHIETPFDARFPHP